MIYHGGLRLIQRGAEADIYLGRWCGQEAIYKVRKSLPYRNESLDRAIRLQRTIREATVMNRVKSAGVRSPYIFYLDPKNTYIVMEYIRGRRLKDLLLAGGVREEVLVELGRVLGRMHSANVIHGDLTTSNVIVESNKLAIIDFGLSYFSTRIEDMATDMRLVKEVMSSVHSSLFPRCFELLVSGYEQVLGIERSRQVKLQLSAIERRGRYAKVE